MRDVIDNPDPVKVDAANPFDLVVVESRRTRITQTFDSVADAVAHIAQYYRRSALAQADNYVEIWLEKGVLWDVTSDYDVPLMVSRGMPTIACSIKRAADADKMTFIYQFCPPPVVERMAVTLQQIEEFTLPTQPTKPGGNTHARTFVGDSVELDALPPRELRDMVHAVIERHVSPEATATLRVAHAGVQLGFFRRRRT